MSTLVRQTAVTTGLSAAVDELTEVQLTRLGEDELLDVLRGVERARRRIEALEARLIVETEQRNLPGKYVMRSTSAFLAGC